MEMRALDPNASLGELPSGVMADIERRLNENDNWSVVGEKFLDSSVLLSMRRKPSPGKELLNRLIKRDKKVHELQGILNISQMYDIQNILITNVPMHSIVPEDDIAQSWELGARFKLCVQVKGSPLPTFQWYHNDNMLPGHTSNTLQFEYFRVEGGGNYWCELKQNLAGREPLRRTSGKFLLTLVPTPPRIITDLHDITCYTHQDLEFAIEVEAYTEVREYTWFRNDTEFRKTSDPSLKILDVDKKTEGRYFCMIGKTCWSKVANVTVLAAPLSPSIPQITQPPNPNAVYCVNDTITLTCKAQCSRPVTFTCFLNDIELVTGPETELKKWSEGDEHTCLLTYVITEDNMETLSWKSKFIFFAESSEGKKLTSVDIKVKKSRKVKTFRAQNKWALLVANCNYLPEERALKTPGRDVMMLARELRKQQFRVWTCNNISKRVFNSVLDRFSSLLQKGDYVLFYFAGHGFSNEMDNYMIPVDVAPHIEKSRTNLGTERKDVIYPDHCISVHYVTSVLQKNDLALFVCIYDMCLLRHTPLEPRKVDDWSLMGTPKGNSVLIYATSSNCATYEDEKTSLMMEHLLSLIGSKESVDRLSQIFKERFQRSAEFRNIQIPKTESDLNEPRSLSDLPTPISDDKAEGGVLQQWEHCASVGGLIEKEVMVGETSMKLAIGFRHCDSESGGGSRDSVTWIISNCVELLVQLSHSNTRTSQPNTTLQSKLKLDVTLSNGKKNVKKERKNLADTCTFKETYPVDIQECEESVAVEVVLSSDTEELLHESLHLEKPAISSIFL